MREKNLLREVQIMGITDLIMLHQQIKFSVSVFVNRQMQELVVLKVIFLVITVKNVLKRLDEPCLGHFQISCFYFVGLLLHKTRFLRSKDS